MSILDHLVVIEETRSDINQKHNPIDFMLLIIKALLSECEGEDIEFTGDEKLSWLKQYRAFKHGIPSWHSTARIQRSVVAESLYG